MRPELGSTCGVSSPLCPLVEWKKSSNKGFSVLDEAVPSVTVIIQVASLIVLLLVISNNLNCIYTSCEEAIVRIGGFNLR